MCFALSQQFLLSHKLERPNWGKLKMNLSEINFFFNFINFFQPYFDYDVTLPVDKVQSLAGCLVDHLVKIVSFKDWNQEGSCYGNHFKHLVLFRISGFLTLRRFSLSKILLSRSNLPLVSWKINGKLIKL